MGSSKVAPNRQEITPKQSTDEVVPRFAPHRCSQSTEDDEGGRDLRF